MKIHYKFFYFFLFIFCFFTHSCRVDDSLSINDYTNIDNGFQDVKHGKFIIRVTLSAIYPEDEASFFFRFSAVDNNDIPLKWKVNGIETQGLLSNELTSKDFKAGKTIFFESPEEYKDANISLSGYTTGRPYTIHLEIIEKGKTSKEEILITNDQLPYNKIEMWSNQDIFSKKPLSK